MSQPQIILQKSNSKNKKYSVVILKGGKKKTVNFGDSRYQDFTIHKDSERKRKYRLRHQNDNITDIFSPGFWSYHILWNKETLDESIKDVEQMYGLNIKLIQMEKQSQDKPKQKKISNPLEYIICPICQSFLSKKGLSKHRRTQKCTSYQQKS